MATLAWKYWCAVLGGTAVVVLYTVFTFVSLSLFPTPYTAAVNWLSDLGNYVYSPNGAIFYNLGCIFTGAALVIFFMGVSIWNLEERRIKAVFLVIQALGIADGVSLVFIGIFSENAPPYHMIWSSIFFFINMVIQVLASIALLVHPKFFKWIAVYGFVTSGINIFFVVTLGDSPAIEWTTVFTALAFAGLIVLNTVDKFKKEASTA